MPYVVMETPPPGVPLQAVVSVGKALDLEANPPPGLIAHAIVERDGRPLLVGMWEDERSYRSFEESRVQPTIERLRSARGAPPLEGPPPPAEVLAAAFFIRGTR